MIINPTSLILPDNYKRDLFCNKRHVDNKVLSKEDKNEYDYQTLFYDIFLDRLNKNLVLVGPPLLNIKKLLFPMKILFNNIKLENPIFIEKESFLSIIIKYPVSQVNNNNHLKIIFKNNLTREFNIEKNKIKFKNNILVTKQKNNKFIWIEDWIKHYQEISVENIIIFDNNSDYQEELLNKYQDNEKILIIPYNFKFGTINCHQNKFMQEACLNNALYRFCHDNWILNFDIDELLNINHQTINKLTKKYNFSYIFNQIKIPLTRELPSEYSFDYFNKSNKDIIKTGDKYMIYSKNTQYLSTHSFISNSIKVNLTNIYKIFFYHYTGITTNWKARYSTRLKVSDETNLIPISKFTKDINISKLNNFKLLLLYKR